jgi:hypothetical protein
MPRLLHDQCLLLPAPFAQWFDRHTNTDTQHRITQKTAYQGMPLASPEGRSMEILSMVLFAWSVSVIRTSRLPYQNKSL